MTLLTSQLIEAMIRSLYAGLRAPMPPTDPCYALEMHQRQQQPHDVEHCEVCDALFKYDVAYHTQQRAALARAIMEPGGVRTTWVVNPGRKGQSSEKDGTHARQKVTDAEIGIK